MALLTGSANVFAQTAWECVPVRFDNNVRAFYADSTDSTLYVGGNFYNVNNAPYMGVVGIRLDGTIRTFPSVPLVVTAITKWQGKLYAGGFGGLAEFDGTSWKRLDTAAGIWALYPYQGKLLVGGHFSYSYSTSADDRVLMEWDGSTFKSFKGLDTVMRDFAVIAITEYKGDLIIAGNLIPYTPADVRFKDIMRWTGTKWDILGPNGLTGGGLDGVTALQVLGNDLYVAGLFSESSGSPGNSIARWDGSNWHRLGQGCNNSIEHMTKQGDTIIVCGRFTGAGGQPASQLARYWNGHWCDGGSTFNSNGWFPSVLADFYGRLYAGGVFTVVNGDSCHRLGYIASWDNCLAQAAVSIDASATMQNGYNLSPNPFTGSLRIQWESNPVACVRYTLTDAAGRAVWNAVSNNAVLELAPGAIASGLYVLRIVEPNGVIHTKKVVRQ